MIEKVNPKHPDKIADRIAGALVDYCYTQEQNPRCAFEVLIGHGKAYIIGETSVHIPNNIVFNIIDRITGSSLDTKYIEVPQDQHLSKNQSDNVRCGDNGIFKGVPLTEEIKELSIIAKTIYTKFPYDGKYILNDKKLTVCQSNASACDIDNFGYDLFVNPLGDWTGGIDVDTGATNRKLGSDMGEAVTGGGLHGKDLSKADVSVNIYAHLKAQETGKVVNLCCAIGDGYVDGKPYAEIVEVAKKYISDLGGFEQLAEWGLI